MSKQVATIEKTSKIVTTPSPGTIANQPESLDAVETGLVAMRSKLFELKQNVDEYSKSLKELEKSYQVQKRKYKKKVRNEKKEKLVKVSKDLVKFMKLGLEGVTTRTQAMKYISNYVHDKNLQIQENKRNFRADKDLAKLFNLKLDHELTFLQINHQLSPHFKALN